MQVKCHHQHHDKWWTSRICIWSNKFPWVFTMESPRSSISLSHQLATLCTFIHFFLKFISPIPVYFFWLLWFPKTHWHISGIKVPRTELCFAVRAISAMLCSTWNLCICSPILHRFTFAVTSHCKFIPHFFLLSPTLFSAILISSYLPPFEHLYLGLFFPAALTYIFPDQGFVWNSLLNSRQMLYQHSLGLIQLSLTSVRIRNNSLKSGEWHQCKIGVRSELGLPWFLSCHLIQKHESHPRCQLTDVCKTL